MGLKRTYPAIVRFPIVKRVFEDQHFSIVYCGSGDSSDTTNKIMTSHSASR
jgi:hypothetical protein